MLNGMATGTREQRAFRRMGIGRILQMVFQTYLDVIDICMRISVVVLVDLLKYCT